MSTIYWALQVADLLELIHVYFVDRSLLYSRNVSTYATLFNAIILLNVSFSMRLHGMYLNAWLQYVSTDAVVVWRAWALCKTEYRKVLFIPVVLLCLTALSVFTTIGLRIASFLTPGGFSFKPVLHAIDICQVSNLVWSLLTNISATSIISHKTWVHRKAIQEGLRSIRNKSTKAERVLALLVESGIIYCLSGATVLISTLIPLPFGTLGDIYTPINIQIAGIYPTIVIVLVGLERTMNNTTFMNTDQGGGVRSRMSQIQFNSDPASTAQRNMTESKITVELVGTDMA
ncbi:hypothetical protein PHLCEN_2v7622 [Hermanssonia centrifuga]|uniref:Uncharacterized protein n=1 Tax=Hermanssonia centrifuga TaxID=98765 RepID=A0A2R6NW63_9APHY|nr:hypothetical protein PHLCEN_2v7622 [Hermanssonia centrifuga]